MRGKTCFGGLDLSDTDDMTSFVLYFPEDDHVILPWSWLPSSKVVAYTASHYIPYVDWVKDGALLESGDDAIEMDEIAELVSKICASYDVKSIAFDRKYIIDFQNAVHRSSRKVPPLVEFPQNWDRFTPAIRRFTELLVTGRFRHPSNAALDLAVKYTGFKMGRINPDDKLLRRCPL